MLNQGNNSNSNSSGGINGISGTGSGSTGEQIIRNPSAFMISTCRRKSDEMSKDVTARAIANREPPMGRDMHPSVLDRIGVVVASGYCRNSEIDDRNRDMMKQISVSECIASLDELQSTDRSKVKNIGGYYIGILKKYLRINRDNRDSRDNRDNRDGHGNSGGHGNIGSSYTNSYADKYRDGNNYSNNNSNSNNYSNNNMGSPPHTGHTSHTNPSQYQPQSQSQSQYQPQAHHNTNTNTNITPTFLQNIAKTPIPTYLSTLPAAPSTMPKELIVMDDSGGEYSPEMPCVSVYMGDYMGLYGDWNVMCVYLCIYVCMCVIYIYYPYPIPYSLTLYLSIY